MLMTSLRLPLHCTPSKTERERMTENFVVDKKVCTEGLSLLGRGLLLYVAQHLDSNGLYQEADLHTAEADGNDSTKPTIQRHRQELLTGGYLEELRPREWVGVKKRWSAVGVGITPKGWEVLALPSTVSQVTVGQVAVGQGRDSSNQVEIKLESSWGGRRQGAGRTKTNPIKELVPAVSQVKESSVSQAPDSREPKVIVHRILTDGVSGKDSDIRTKDGGQGSTIAYGVSQVGESGPVSQVPVNQVQPTPSQPTHFETMEEANLRIKQLRGGQMKPEPDHCIGGDGPPCSNPIFQDGLCREHHPLSRRCSVARMSEPALHL
jgi:hypothetical protein